ncbi:hypothetical protein FPZ54_05925 [Sphingomonas suaedae]|uniref:Uncharacterized protein n=1 Tax=Sphingomonas suaedae TaxID=2599297 RepID=A0A518RDT3_9SPHN|nr:hypothetical protein [Sphingomonas suaedae]QDX25599.1 hypothetical protein FPZ54_05925 [Sphingomonas suaedae]
MRQMILVLATAGLLAGCGGGQTASNVTANQAVENTVEDTTNYQAEVLALNLRAREGVFLRAVRDAGLSCQSVTASERVEDRGGDPTWRATCDDRNPHLISITKDGTANIVSRTDAD